MLAMDFQVIMSPVINMAPVIFSEAVVLPPRHPCLLPSITYDPQTPVWPRLVF